MKTRSYAALAAFVTLALTSACAGASEPRVIVQTTRGETPVRVEVAATPAKRSLGLMYRKELAEDAGMLFVFDETEEHSFWMKNTPLLLDMLFIDERGAIVGVVANATPFTTTPRTVGKPSRYVLEVNGGWCERHGVRAGDRVRFEGVAGVEGPP